jgi:23S rRNA A2030 N6-methylase RlmJ
MIFWLQPYSVFNSDKINWNSARIFRSPPPRALDSVTVVWNRHKLFKRDDFDALVAKLNKRQLQRIEIFVDPQYEQYEKYEYFRYEAVGRRSWMRVKW